MQGLVERLENGDFILESKMVELNQNKKIQNNRIDGMVREKFSFPGK